MPATCHLADRTTSYKHYKVHCNGEKYLDERKDECRGVVYYLGSLDCTVNDVHYVPWKEWVRIFLESLGEAVSNDPEYFMMQLARIPLRFIEGNCDDAACSGDAYEVPLIVFYENRRFEVPYQKRYLGELLRLKRNSHYAFVFARNDEYNYFWNNFGKNFQK